MNISSTIISLINRMKVLKGVFITTPSPGDILVFRNGKWVNEQPSMPAGTAALIINVGAGYSGIEKAKATPGRILEGDMSGVVVHHRRGVLPVSIAVARHDTGGWVNVQTFKASYNNNKVFFDDFVEVVGSERSRITIIFGG